MGVWEGMGVENTKDKSRRVTEPAIGAHIERQSLQLFTRNQRLTLCEKYGAKVKSVDNGGGVARQE